jgi:hypothetical protein
LYIFDTCSFITIELHYPIKNFPSIWKNIEILITNDKLISTEVVYKEILNGKDIIKEWAKDNSNIFKPISQELQIVTKEIINKYPLILDFRKNKSGADPFVIGLAKINNGIVVTEEKPSGGPEKLKIPDLCKFLKIPCMSLIDVFKREQIKI